MPVTSAPAGSALVTSAPVHSVAADSLVRSSEPAAASDGGSPGAAASAVGSPAPAARAVGSQTAAASDGGSPGAAASDGGAIQPLSQAQVAAAFTGSIQRVPLSIGYKLSLAAVSCLMVLLPLVYMALIVLLILGAAKYAVAGVVILQSSSGSGRRGAGPLLLYLGPLVAAAITVIFMIKPFFARMPKAAKPRSVTREEQPILFDFVARICQAVGAPMPKRIDIDTEVNASASFRSGWLSLLQPNDLVLTIGMPLVKGMSVRELGGILAHEFGHFSQGVGMRLTYIIRSINMWFARVVYQRDRADEWLASAAKNSDIRFGIVLYLTIGVVWLTRRILWLLMMLGHLVSSMLMRQMEYDADSYEIQFAGTHAFGGTFGKLQRLGLAYQQSIHEAQEFFTDGKLVDDLPSLVRINRNMQSDDLIKKLEEHVAKNVGNWLDTHPTDAQRIAAADKINAPGVFELDAPAEALFVNVDQLSKSVTREFFKSIFGDEFKESMLASVQQLTSFKQAAQDAEEARKRMFTEAFTNPRAMSLGLPVECEVTEEDVVAQLQQAKATMDAAIASYEANSKKFDEVDNLWLHGCQASALLQCGAKLKATDWKDLPVHSQPLLSSAVQQSQMELEHLHNELLAFEQAFAQRVDAAVQWLYVKVRHDPNSPYTADLKLGQGVLQTLSAMDDMHRTLVHLRNDFVAVVTMFGAAGENMTDKHRQCIQSYGDRIKSAIAEINQRFSGVTYPFEHAGGTLTMSRYLAPEAAKVRDYGEAFQVTEGLLKNYQYAYFRSIGTLAAIIEKVENAVS